MNDLGPVGRASLGALGHNGRLAQSYKSSTAAPTARGGDEVELSQAARLLSKLNELPEIRQDLVDRVRSEIARGTYESAGKLEAAIEGLMEDLV